MPAALFYGKETYAGAPLSGLASHYIASFLTQEMEWNADFQETVLGETTPLPVTLQQKDLRLEYSTQTPYRLAALYNIFVMKQTAADVFDQFERVANIAADKCNDAYPQVCQKNNVDPIGDVKVIRYQDLLEHATTKFETAFVDAVKRIFTFTRNGMTRISASESRIS